MSKIQLSDEGSWPAPPSKLSAHTWFQPESGGGTDASACCVRGIVIATAAAAAPNASRLRRRAGAGGEWGLGMAVTSLSRSGRGSECLSDRPQILPRLMEAQIGRA